MTPAAVAILRDERMKKVQENAQRVAEMSDDERTALYAMRREARHAGVVLSNRGIGGLPPSLVLGVMRRDEWTCKVHGDKGEGDNGGIQVHHKGGLDNPTSRWLLNKGHSNDPTNIVTVCAKAHDEIHARDRAAPASAVVSRQE